MRLALPLLALLAAPPARAQEPDPKAQARQHFDRGMTHYNLAEWDAAIAEFERAYALSREPDLLFNIGQAKRLKGDRRGALDSYRSYLRLAPQAANRAEVEKHIAELEQQERRPKERTPAPGPPPGSPKPDNQVMRVDAKVMRVEVKGRRENSVLTWTGLIVAGAGLVGLGAGTYYGVRARQNWSEVEGINQDSLDWGDREQAYWDDAEAQERRAKVLLGVGAATVIVGGVLYVIGARAGGDTQLSATASPGGAVVGVSGAF